MATDGTEVRPDSLSEFGRKCVDESEIFGKEAGSAMMAISSAIVGACDLEEGNECARAYANSVQALQVFYDDAITGMLACGYGGITLADNYRNADQSLEEQMKCVDAAFNPAGDTPSIASRRAEQEDATATRRAEQEDVAEDAPPPREPAPPLSTTVAANATATAAAAGPLTPQEQVDAHQASYPAHYQPEETLVPGPDHAGASGRNPNPPLLPAAP